MHAQVADAPSRCLSSNWGASLLGICHSCSVRISALALLKMAMHARSGGTLEVMGMLQGKTVGDTFVVMDAFALPVEGTETRVNAQNEAYEFMVDFIDTNKSIGRWVSARE